MDHPTLHLAFDGGTLVVTGPDPERLAALPYCRFDARTNVYRAEAVHYRALVEHLRRETDSLQGRGPRLPADAVAAAHQPRPLPAPDRSPANVVEGRRPRRRRAADRHRQDLPRHPRHQQDRPARPRRDADHRPAQSVVRRIARRLRRPHRPARRRLLRHSSRSPSPPTIPPTSIWNAGAIASACWSSTNAIICRGRRTWRRPSAASPRIVSA